MKRFVAILALVGFTVAALMTWPVTAGEKEYASTLPGELYFILWTNVAAGNSTHTWTNQEDFAWTPSNVRVTYPTNIAAGVLTIDHIAVITDQVFEEYRVVTNEFSSTVTNYLHGLTNTTETLITNAAIVTVTHSAEATEEGTGTDDYIQKGDILTINLGWTTDATWIKITGKR